MIVPRAPQVIANIFGFALTNTVLTATIVSLLIIIVALYLSSKLDVVPSKFQNFIEVLIDSIKGIVSEQTQGDTKRINLFFPWVATFFILIALNNLFEILPFVGIISFYFKHAGITVPIFRTANSDLNSTIALTLISVVVTQYLAIKQMGILHHLKRYFNFTKPLNIFSGIFELISEFTKLISLSFRLYGNIYAGDVIIILFTKLGGMYFLPLPFLAFEILIDIIQAGIFAMLTLSFMTILTDKDELVS